MTAPAPADPFVRRTRALALATLLALIGLGLAWELVLAPTGSGTLALKVIPLALGVAGLLRHRLYTFRWLALLVWIYFAEGVVRAWSEHGWGRALALAEVALSLVLFTASTAYIRHRLRSTPAPSPAPGAAA
ncbi:MAG: DUF2069 domain-containing protein [Burkholderiales bacterium]|nr:DUF2069 domain-containing protein [Burkholderiales bacterium]MDE2455159.1 DUF2069 domain-containing protein [Burkholderiales bacterium]